MKEIYYFVKKIKSLYIQFIYIILLDSLYSFNISALKMNFSLKKKNYVILILLIMIKGTCILNIGMEIILYDILKELI